MRGERLRVVRIIDRLNVGGPAQHVAWLTAGADPAAFTTTLLTGSIAPGEGDMSDVVRAAGVEPLVIPGLGRAIGPRDVLVVVRLLRELRRLAPAIVHTHKAKAGAVGRVAVVLYRWLTPQALLLRPRPCRVVHTYHGHVFHGYFGRPATRLFVAIERLLARLATDRIVTVSEQQRREIRDRFRVGTPEQFRVIPLGIDLDRFGDTPGTLRRDLGIPAGEPVVGTVGRLCAVKHHAMLLDAVARLGRAGVRAWLAVVGDGALRADLAARARRLGIDGRVAFLGFRRDLPALYPDCDVVALTSVNEGTPVTLLEAMACGRPVVATEVGGVVDILGTRRERRDGFTVWEHGLTGPSRDPETFARALGFVLERPALGAAMGARGRAFVRARMGHARLVRDTENLYDELVGRVRGGGAEDAGAHHRGGGVHRLSPGGAVPRAG